MLLIYAPPTRPILLITFREKIERIFEISFETFIELLPYFFLIRISLAETSIIRDGSIITNKEPAGSWFLDDTSVSWRGSEQ